MIANTPPPAATQINTIIDNFWESGSVNAEESVTNSADDDKIEYWPTLELFAKIDFVCYKNALLSFCPYGMWKFPVIFIEPFSTKKISMYFDDWSENNWVKSS